MRYSKQRDLVYNIIARDDRHYIVDEIYDLAKAEMPEIGIATVYRNVNQLVEANKVKRIKGIDGVDHYDAITKVHPHFLCKCCLRVYDAKVPQQELMNEIVKCSDGEVEDIEITFKGICQECKEKEKQSWN